MIDYQMGQASKLSGGLATNADNPSTIRVWNPFTGEEIRKIDLAPRTHANLNDDRYIVLLEPLEAKLGKLHFLDLDSLLYQVHQVPRDTNLDLLQTMRFEGRLIVFCFDIKEWRDGAAQAKALKATVAADQVLACGLIYALNVDDGSQLWKAPRACTITLSPSRSPKQRRTWSLIEFRSARMLASTRRSV